MSYRRREGTRARRRKKVTRQELVAFFRVASMKQRAADARKRAERLAWALRTVAIAAAVAVASFYFWPDEPARAPLLALAAVLACLWWRKR